MNRMTSSTLKYLLWQASYVFNIYSHKLHNIYSQM